MKEEDIENFMDSIENAFKSENPKFRNPSLSKVLESAQTRIKIEQKASPNIVSEKELLQWGIALEATYRMAERETQNKHPDISFGNSVLLTNGNENVQKVIGEIMKRPISEEQLGLLLVTSPGRYDCPTIHTPFFQHYNGGIHGDDSIYQSRGIITDPEKSQKFIKAVYSMPIKGFEDDPKITLLKIYISESVYSGETGKMHDKGIAEIFAQEANKVKEGNRVHAVDMMEELSKLNKKGDISDIMNHCPAATMAYQELQKACVEDYRAELAKMSPINMNNTNNTKVQSASRNTDR